MRTFIAIQNFGLPGRHVEPGESVKESEFGPDDNVQSFIESGLMKEAEEKTSTKSKKAKPGAAPTV